MFWPCRRIDGIPETASRDAIARLGSRYTKRPVSLDWESEVDLVDRQKHAAQDAYHAFWAYAEMLSDRYVADGIYTQVDHLDAK